MEVSVRKNSLPGTGFPQPIPQASNWQFPQSIAFAPFCHPAIAPLVILLPPGPLPFPPIALSYGLATRLLTAPQKVCSLRQTW